MVHKGRYLDQWNKKWESPEVDSHIYDQLAFIKIPGQLVEELFLQQIFSKRKWQKNELAS